MKFLTLIALSLLISCATPYQSKGLRGGLTDIQLDVNVFQVHFIGNGYTDRSRAIDFVLLRSAELTLEHGYNYFAIIKEGDLSKHVATITPELPNSTTSFTFSISRPSASNTIVCFYDRPENTFVYNADMVYTNIRETYGIL